MKKFSPSRRIEIIARMNIGYDGITKAQMLKDIRYLNRKIDHMWNQIEAQNQKEDEY